MKPNWKMIMTKIEQIWTALEADATFAGTMVYQRFAADIPTDLLVGIRGVEKQRWIGIGYAQKKVISLAKWSKLKDIKVENRHNPNGQPPYLLMIALENPILKDLFSIVCTDLMDGIAFLTDNHVLVKTILNRFEKWLLLFEKFHTGALTTEAQQGLYGELCFLRHLLNTEMAKKQCIQCWKGAEAHFHDFHWQHWAMEIKTTTAQNASAIHISSEKQLDDTGLHFLGLCHYIVDNQSDTGETLNEIIETIDFLLQSSNAGLSLFFKNKLTEMGYFKAHEAVYQPTHYTLMEQHYYQIGATFPRLIPKMLPVGIENVKYLIHTQSFVNHRISESNIFKNIL
jgi:Putative  PD-(D/E)XK family member, (DUF4420)